MQFGIQMFPADYAIPVTELARACEDLGFESLFFPEHTHIPTSRISPWPGGAELPKEYSHTLDPFVALGAVAAVTKTLKMGTGVCLIIERDPITTAKEVASVDHLSGGRMLFGIGGGWNLEEMENHGTKPSLRWKLLRERVLAMKAIWTEDAAEFHGEHVNFDPVWSWPKPVQKPHPPVLVGGNGPRTLDRVLEFGDGWIPTGRPSVEFADRVAELQSRAKAMGRGHIPVTVFGVAGKEKAVEHFVAAGVDRVLFTLPSLEREGALAELKALAELAKRYS